MMNRRTGDNTLTPRGALSEKQELLLSRFHDGECSFLSAFFARRLVSQNANARSYLNDLRGLKNHCSHLVESSSDSTVDLWARIDARIEQEQRAAYYLGTRQPEHSRESLWQRLSIGHAVMGGLSGAAIAAALILVVSRPSQLMTFSAPAAGPVTGHQIIHPVGIGSASAPRTQFKVTPARAHNPLEVDWMRANGSLKLIPDPSGSSAIIWVRRRPLAEAIPPPSQRTPRMVRPTPLGSAVASSRTERPRLDEMLQSGAK